MCLGLKILTQSKNAACISGDQVGFTIETSKTAKAYQWFLNENKISNEDDDYEGSTTKHLSISKCLPKHKGSYKCVVITELDTVLTSKVAILIIGELTLWLLFVIVTLFLVLYIRPQNSDPAKKCCLQTRR